MTGEQIKALCEAEQQSEASFKCRSQVVSVQLIHMVTPIACVKSLIV